LYQLSCYENFFSRKRAAIARIWLAVGERAYEEYALFCVLDFFVCFLIREKFCHSHRFLCSPSLVTFFLRVLVVPSTLCFHSGRLCFFGLFVLLFLLFCVLFSKKKTGVEDRRTREHKRQEEFAYCVHFFPFLRVRRAPDPVCTMIEPKKNNKRIKTFM